ncbi:MAG TPA: Gfo/Idh/MocA family oxidoreductase [Candidatus Binatus sp.]|nr:Gfo/Idh/MocA family oxidoreductase [Candidatus Binatus sp.]
MRQPFRLAMVGAGKIAASAHLPAALALPNVQLVAIVDPVVARGQALAREFGASTRAVAQLDDVLGELDGAIIATPNFTHCEVALKCIEAGVATLIEKPLATTVEEGETIARAARERGVTVAVGYTTRFDESVRVMAQLLKAGDFGEVRRFAYQSGSKGRWAPLTGYTLDRRATGGGVVMVTGTHFLDRMLSWFGYPDEIAYEDDADGGPEANALAHFGYTSRGRFKGRVRFSKTVSLKGGFVMETDEGMVVLLDDLKKIVFRPRSQPSVETIVRERHGFGHRERGHFQLQLEDFVEAAQTGRPATVSAEQGVESLRLIEALYTCRQPMRTDWYACPPRERQTA